MATAKQGAGKKTQSDTKKAQGDEKKSTAKKSTAGKSEGGAKKGANQGFAKPVQPSADLAPVVGKNPMPRTEITKKVWDYIKANNLQDPANRRMINADDKLRPVFGGKDQVSMFEMTKLVNQHLK